MKPYSTKKIGKGVKRPSSKNMVGIKNKPTKIKSEITRLHSCQKSAIRELKLDMKKIDKTIISTLGLDRIPTSEIEGIQDKRKSVSMHMVNVVSNLVVLSRKLSHLENRYQAK